MMEELSTAQLDWLPNETLEHICHFLPDSDFPMIQKVFYCSKTLHGASYIPIYTLRRRQIRRLSLDLFKANPFKSDDLDKILEAVRLYRESGGNARQRFEAVKNNKKVTNILKVEVLERFSTLEANSQQLILFAKQGNSEAIAQQLEQEDIWINAADDEGWTPLHHALAKKYEQIAALLIEKGADVNMDSITGATSIKQAALWGMTDLVRLLIQKGALVDGHGVKRRTALFFAADGGHSKIARLLIQAGADVNATDDERYTPLDLAVTWRHVDTAKLLLEHGATINFDRPPLHTLLMAATADLHDPTYLKLLVEHDEKVGCDAIFMALALERHELLINLIKAGADFNVVNDKSETPLHLIARMGGDPKIVELLIEQGADVNATDNKDFTPLHYALQNGHNEIAELLKTASKSDTQL